MSNIRRFSMALLLPVLGFSCHAAFAGLPHTYTVGPNASTCDFTTIQAAVMAATQAGDTIVLGNGLSFFEHVAIADRAITIKAGASCIIGPAQPLATAGDPSVEVSGTGTGNVFTITGISHVTLIGLDILGGNKSSGNGGGISFDGYGSLTLDTCWVRANSADSGGGISFNGTAETQSQLNIGADTQILSNTANTNDGGGILVQGNSLLSVTGPRAQINANHALNGYGGGIDVIGPAIAKVSSPDFDNGTSVVAGNSARYGGGIAIMATYADNGSPNVYIFSTDASQPVGIAGNTASHTGGGIYLRPAIQALPYAVNAAMVQAWDYRIEDNVAQEGAAIYADTDSEAIDGFTVGSGVILGDADLVYPRPAGSVRCTNSRLCNTINGNRAKDDSENLTSVILMQTSGNIEAKGFSMRSNNAAHVIRLVGDDTFGTLSECLIAGNGLADPVGNYTQELLYASGNDTPFVIDSCTFADDLIGTTHMIHTESDLTLKNSIIAEAGTLALDYSGIPANLHVLYVLSNDITTLPASGDVIPGVPTFVDETGGDYHLKATSLGIDFAPSDGDTVDLDGNPRETDLPSAPNIFGNTQDLGAYELQNGFRECGMADSVFCDGYDH